MQAADDILTVLVLYNTKLHECAAYKSLSAAAKDNLEKKHLFIYDNSPEGHAVTPAETWIIYYVHDPTNPGVSKAYNEACSYASQHGLTWMLLADQDTNFPGDIFDQYQRARRTDPDCSIFAPTLVDNAGIVSPFRHGVFGGTRLKIPPHGKTLLQNTCAINSGLLISVGLFQAAGGYDERLRLDFSDVHFFRKLSRHVGYYTVVDTVCRHTLSSSHDTTLKDALNRFIIYVEGSRITGREFGRALFFELYAILRAVKLSWKYRSLRFVGSLLSRA